VTRLGCWNASDELTAPLGTRGSGLGARDVDESNKIYPEAGRQAGRQAGHPDGQTENKTRSFSLWPVAEAMYWLLSPLTIYEGTKEYL
jgi:hypothetical protein